MKHKRLFAALTGILLATVMLCTSSFAWFYFPSSKNLIIKTAPDLPIETTLYHLETASDGTRSFVEMTEPTSTPGSYDLGNRELVFFQWGGEYICESEVDDYYALEMVYDSDAYSDGYLSAILQAELSCASVIDPADEDPINLRFGLVTVNCALAAKSDTVVTSSAAVSEALSDETTYTAVVFEKKADDKTDPTYDITGAYDQPLHALQSDVYNYTYTDADNLNHGEIRLVMYIRISADSDGVTSRMEDEDLVDFGDKTLVQMTNNLTISAILRSIPKKTNTTTAE